MANSGTVRWPTNDNPIWRLHYSLSSGEDGSRQGIALARVYFRGKEVLHKATLPRIRVRYAGDKPFWIDDSLTATYCPGGVQVLTQVSHGIAALVIEGYFEIGQYRLTQRWVLRADGIILPQLFSAGLQWEADHTHHVFWRFDFDIGGAGNDIALEHNSTSPDSGFGDGWKPYPKEAKRNKNDATGRYWQVRDDSKGIGYLIFAGWNDGRADSLVNGDIWFLRYHRNEDQNGNEALPPSHGVEPIYKKDLLVWYCAHLFHLAGEDPNEWHQCGPVLWPIGSW